MFTRVAQICLAVSITFGIMRAEVRADEERSSAHEASEYHELVRLAAEEFNLGNFSEARALFLRAHTLEPNARTFRGLGFSEFELRRYPQAVRQLRDALASDVKPLSPELRESTAALLRRAERYIGRVRLALVPTHAAVTLDGEPIEPTDELVLTVGDHVLEFAATGFAAQRRPLQIAGGEREELRVTLSPLEVERATVPSERQPSDATPARRKWWVWTSIVAVAAAGAVTAVLLSRREPGIVYETTPSPNAVLDDGLRVPERGRRP